MSACRTISFLTNEASSETVSLIINSEVSLCKSMVDLLNGLLPLLLSIIKIGNKPAVIKEACRIISVIAATKKNIQALIDAGFMAALDELTTAGQDVEKDIKNEAVLAIADIAKFNNTESPEAEQEDHVE